MKLSREEIHQFEPNQFVVFMQYVVHGLLRLLGREKEVFTPDSKTNMEISQKLNSILT